MLEAFHFEFMQNALMAGILTSLICGIMGTLVVVNRIVFLSGGIAHAAYGGIGLAFFFGWSYLTGTIGFAFAAAMIMAAVSLKARHRSDTIIGVIWAVGMASGVILLDLTPGYNVDLMSYLFGSILTVPKSDISIMAIVAVGITCITVLSYNTFLAISYDEEFARICGIPVGLFYFLMIGMVAITIVLVIQVVGLILVIALLTIPPLIMERYAKSLAQMMVGSSVLSILFTVIGLLLSYRFNITSGASIIMVAGMCFFLIQFVDWLIKFCKAKI